MLPSMRRLPVISLIVVLLLTVLSLLEVPSAQNAVEGLKLYDQSPAFRLRSNSDYFLIETKNSIETAKKRLLLLLDDSLGYVPEIILAPDLKTFNEAIGQKIPDWGAGVAIGERRLIVIKSPANFNLMKSYPELLSHEYAHLLIDQMSHFKPVPRWFNEGIAMYTSMEWNWSDNLAMSRTAVFSSFVPLGEIELMNRFNSGKAETAYAQSYLAITFMVEECGANAPGRFLKALAEGNTPDEAIYIACGSISMKEFEKDFNAYLQNRYNVASLFMDMFFLWIFLAIVVVVGFFLKFRKRRQYFKKWAEEERLQSTDFDYGDPDNPELPDDDEPWRS